MKNRQKKYNSLLLLSVSFSPSTSSFSSYTMKLSQCDFVQCKRGFTLVELLVTCALLAVIAAVILFGLVNARNQSKDARAMADIKQIQRVVEIYYDQNGTYPTPTCATSGGWYRSDKNASGECWIVLQSTLGSWLPKLPVHPDNTGNYVYAYKPQNGGAGYCIATIFKVISNQPGDGCYTGGFCLGASYSTDGRCGGVVY